MSVERPAGERPGSRFRITERATLRMAESIMSNYRDPQLAVLDLVDNTIDNRIDTKPLRVTIQVRKGEIYIRNVGGAGLDQQGLENFLNWGHSEKGATQIGQYGVGGKAAMGFLGRSLEVRCSPQGSDEEYRFVDPDWKSKGEIAEKEHEGEIGKAFTQEGYFTLRITNAEKTVNPKALIAKLGDVYRSLLLDKKISISVNGTEVPPLEIKYLDSEPEHKPEILRVHTGFGDHVDMKVGVLESGQDVRPGIRGYYRGRLIEDGLYFGLRRQDDIPQLSRLIGEAHLDILNVTTNKSDFIHDLRWEHVDATITQALLPWKEKLANLRLDQSTPVEPWERDLLRQTKREIEGVFAYLGLITRASLPGESWGRLPPTPREDVPPPTGRTRKVGPREGATASDYGAVVGPTVRRWGVFRDWEAVPLGLGQRKRSEVGGEKGDILRIDSESDLYQYAKISGDRNLKSYIAETVILAATQAANPKLSGQELEEMVNVYMSEFARRNLSKFTYEDERRRRRG